MSNLISRQVAIKAIADLENCYNGFSDTYDKAYIIGVLEELPTEDAVPVKHGKWIYGNDFHWYTASCNKCGYQRRTDIKAEGWNQWKYCPNCGARMDAERKDHGQNNA